MLSLSNVMALLIRAGFTPSGCVIGVGGDITLRRVGGAPEHFDSLEALIKHLEVVVSTSDDEHDREWVRLLEGHRHKQESARRRGDDP